MSDPFIIDINPIGIGKNQNVKNNSQNNSDSGLISPSSNNIDLDELYEEYAQAEQEYNNAVENQENEDETSEKISTLESQKSSIDTEITACNGTIAELNSRILSFSELTEPNKESYAHIEGEGEDATVTYPGYDEAYQEYETQKAQLDELKSQLEQANSRLQGLNNDKSRIEGEINNLNQGNVAGATTDVQTAQAEMEDIEARIDEAEVQQKTDSIDEPKDVNEYIDNESIEVLKQIAAKYTNRTDLTEEDYQHILAMEQVSQNFYSLYGQYQNELSTEGWIDDVYDGLKDIFGGITRQDVQNEFDNYFEQIDAMTKILNGKEEEVQELLFKELERKLSDDPDNSQNILIEYCGSEEKALEVINNWLSNNTEMINAAFFNYDAMFDAEYMMTYRAVMENGEIRIKETKNGEESDFCSLNEAADISGNVPFYPLNIIQNNEDVKNLAPKDFESVWEFYNGVEYNPEKIEASIQKGYEFTQINVGLATAYNMEQKLQNTTPKEAFDIFKEQFNGDEDSAITAFNNYYSSILEELGSSNFTDTFDNKLTQIRAQKNDKGEIELIARYESMDPDDNYSLDYYYSHNEGDNFCDVDLNYAEVYDDDSYMYANSIFVSNELFWQINNTAAEKNLLQERYKTSFKEANNGYTVEEALKDYANLRTEAFGNGKVEKLLNEYISDMDSYSQKLSTIMTIGGIGLSFICPAFGYVAMAGVFVDNTIDGINMATNEKQGENWQSLVEETFKEAAFMAIGMGINATAQSAHNALTQTLLKGGKSLKYATTAGTALEVGVDGALSIGFDVLTTGELNLSGNSIGLLLDIASGIRGYKAIKASRAAAASPVDGAGKYSSANSADGAAGKYSPEEMLRKYGISDKNAQSILDAQKFEQAKVLMDLGVDKAYVKEFSTKLSDEQFDKCINLIKDGMSPSTAKQLSKLSDSDIQRALKLKAQGTPDMNLADTAVLTGEKALRVDNMLSDGAVSPYYIDKFASLEGGLYDDAIALVKSGKFNAPEALDAVSGKNFDLDSALAAGPQKAKQQITSEIEKILTEEASKLYSEYASHIGEVQDGANKMFDEVKGQSGELTAREKGVDSSLKKLLAKYENGKLKINAGDDPRAVTSACRKALADAYGTRLQVEKLTPDRAKQIVSQSGIDYDTFLREVQESIRTGKTDNLSPESVTALNALKEAQTQKTVDRLIERITADENPFIITELNNYGNEISSYFTPKQILEIADAYHRKTGELLPVVSKAEPDSTYIEVRTGYENGEIKDIKVLKNAEGEDIGEFKVNGAEKGSGYASTQMNTVYLFEDGSIGYGELQIRSTDLNTFADREHIPYDIRQGKITGKDVEYSSVLELIKSMSSGSYRKYNQYLNGTYEFLRLNELGITEVSVPDMLPVYTTKAGVPIPIDIMNKISYDSLLKFH